MRVAARVPLKFEMKVLRTLLDSQSLEIYRIRQRFCCEKIGAFELTFQYLNLLPLSDYTRTRLFAS